MLSVKTGGIFYAEKQAATYRGAFDVPVCLCAHRVGTESREKRNFAFLLLRKIFSFFLRILLTVMLMYALKLKTAGLCRGIRLKCFLLGLAFFTVLLCFLICLSAGIMCAAYGAENAFGLPTAFFDFFSGAALNASVSVLLVAAAIFFAVCAASLCFALKTEYYYAADKNQSRPAGFVSFGSGVRYLSYKAVVFVKKSKLFARFMLPFFIGLLIAAVVLKVWGMDRLTLYISLAALVFLFVYGCFCFYVWCRQYDEGIYLMYLNRMLSARDAALSSEEKTAGRLLQLAAYRVSLLPRKLGCLMLLPLPFFMTFAGVFSGLVCEKLYGENKRRVKIPAVTFYINKKSRFEALSD